MKAHVAKRSLFGLAVTCLMGCGLAPFAVADDLARGAEIFAANCATCHQGASKPLLGQSMAKDFPELGGKATP